MSYQYEENARKMLIDRLRKIHGTARGGDDYLEGGRMRDHTRKKTTTKKKVGGAVHKRVGRPCTKCGASMMAPKKRMHRKRTIGGGEKTERTLVAHKTRNSRQTSDWQTALKNYSKIKGVTVREAMIKLKGTNWDKYIHPKKKKAGAGLGRVPTRPKRKLVKKKTTKKKSTRKRKGGVLVDRYGGVLIDNCRY